MMNTVHQPTYPRCIFCDDPDPTSKEHILPAWIWRMAEAENIKTADIAYYEANETNGYLGWPTITRASDATIPIMCKDCNTRWGSKLQAKSMSTLKPFISGGWLQLTESKKKTLARWFTNYIMVREMLHPNLVTYSQEHRKAFRYQGTIPHKLNIWIAQISSPGFFNMHRAMKDNARKTSLLRPDMHITAQEIGHILLVGYGAPLDGCHGAKSYSYKALQNIMKAFGFVPVLAANTAFETEFPTTAPHKIQYNDLLQLFDNMTDTINEPFQNWDVSTLLCQPHRYN